MKFREFLPEVVAVYGDLLLYSETGWLSTNQRYQRFFALRKEILIFLKNKMKSDTTETQNKTQDPELLANLAFSTYMTKHLNELNLKERTLHRDGKFRKTQLF